MKITILTLFPKMFDGFLSESIIGRARKGGKIKIEVANLRDWGIGKRKQVDDTPYGGGAGMVLRVDVVAKAIHDTKLKVKSKKLKVILMTPQGEKFNQNKAKELADYLASGSGNLLLVCGHYEGFDERIRDYVDEEISIGDYVLTGGELPAAVITDAVVRLLPGVLGKEASHQNESFSITSQNSNLNPQTYLEHEQYTKPEEFEGKKVPEILLSGHHAKIAEWRQERSLKRTRDRRPDLIIAEPDFAKILQKGGVAVIPTDTIYGIVGQALNRQTVQRIYKIKKRAPEKPFIILISSIRDLKLFGVKINKVQKEALSVLWPGPVSIIFKCGKSLTYLHRGTRTLAFRLPADKGLLDVIRKTGPLVAPSANPEGLLPAETVDQARKYFSEIVDYYKDGGLVRGPSSTLIDFTGEEPKIIRGDDTILLSLAKHRR